MNEIEDQLKIIEQYQDKVAELNHLLNEGMLDKDEYDELVQDFKDVEAIRNDIKNEELKQYAEVVVKNLAKLLL
tara:strand:- start:2051 stop:2272 length:222 start_codon:yes stop_codon:yes gene_type:complete